MTSHNQKLISILCITALLAQLIDRELKRMACKLYVVFLEVAIDYGRVEHCIRQFDPTRPRISSHKAV